jgi:hypothetical protein
MGIYCQMKKNDTQREERAMTSYRCLYRAAIALAVIVLVNMVVSAAWAQKAKVIYVSWGDNILLSKGDAQLDTPDKIDRQMRFWKEDCAADIVLWRVSSLICQQQQRFGHIRFKLIAVKLRHRLKGAEIYGISPSQQFPLHITVNPSVLPAGNPTADIPHSE